MIGIYKITNKINGHSYIGQSVHIEKRMREHKLKYNWEREKNKTLYQAFQKYGIENFSFEIIEECEANILNIREQFWIAHYNTYNNGYNMTCGGETNHGDNHPRHRLTKEDVIVIRTRYNNRERKNVVYEDYKERIGESGFGKIWKGETWKHVMPEVYSVENRTFHANNTGNSGSKNGRARLTEQDVYNIRLRRKNGEVLSHVYEDYKHLITYGSFTNVWTYQNWKNITV